MKLLFSFKGRIGRLKYAAIIILLFFVKAFIYALTEGIDFREGIMINSLGNIFILIIALTVTVKRLRDIDLNPWFSFFILIPFVNLILFLYLFFKKGQDWQTETIKKVFEK